MLYRLLPLALLFVLVLGLRPLGAQERGDMFTVSDVAVDVTAGTAAAAREQAFVDGQRKAFRILLDRLGADATRIDPETLPESQMTQVLQGFQVDQESTSAGRYVATLTYQFRPEEVRRLLQGQGIAFTETRSKPVVVIPIYRSDAGTRLWDSPNPWLDAWLDFPGGERLVPLVVPFGDLQDIRDVRAENALSGDRAALQAIADRYGAGSALVAVAEPGAGGLDVAFTHYDPDLGDSSSTITVAEGADDQARLAAAVEQVAATLDEAWRVRTRVPSGERNTISLLVPLGGDAGSWFSMRTRLRRVPTVVATRVVSLSPQEAVLELDYIGDDQQLRLALAQQDLMIEQGPYAPQLRPAGTGGGAAFR